MTAIQQHHFFTALWNPFRRPDCMTEGTRWLFTWFAVASVLLTVPIIVASDTNGVLLVALTAAVALIASWCSAFILRRIPLALDLIDFVAFVALALTLPDPMIVLGVMFGAIWLRGLYGSTARSFIRCSLYSLALVITVVLWVPVNGSAAMTPPVVVLGTIPTLFLTVVIVRQLSMVLVSREQSMRRDRELSATGTLLLGVIDEADILVIGWAATQELCLATPGLRVLRVMRDGPVLRVDGATGQFDSLPAQLPGTVITSASNGKDASATDVDSLPLDAAVGTPLAWACLASNAQANTWILVGAPGTIPAEALVSVRALSNQVSLALRNSTVQGELTVQVSSDPLTGLNNRASFMAKLTAILGTVDDASGVHIFFLDLDDFKDVNDLLGHRAGNELLIEVAERMRSNTGSNAICARLGGDEFAIILAGKSDSDALCIATALGRSIAEPVTLERNTAQVGVSIGIATAAAGIDIEDLVHQADVAMYAAKANGKNRVQVFEPGLLRVDNPRVTFEWQLAAAAAADELVVHYQPILDLPGLQCTAVEALVRWQHPERGLLFPGDFIDIAERTGAIIGIGAFVMRRACLDAAAWRTANPGAPMAVHVNVSAHELDCEGFVDSIIGCLADTGTLAKDLIIELTETVVLDSPAAIGRLRAIGALGVGIAIDDFGTGYASLTSLRALPVDIVKIDMSFVAGAVSNPFDRSVIEAIVRLCAQLGVATVAEGVERLDQQRLLEALGTGGVQGYLYSRPLSAADLTAWLEANRAAAGGAETDVGGLLRTSV
ncbi:putative bifunctional diguanylate cyclase/phosphodiesterase [Cryobacterium glucosi]|uniref:EAL domain-containing protein n=1 Tax=Cryobacterium glucosi TaxID=1259175 RepID=A0ABY2IPB4_9MICO|nr:EAL domain-containing protein [Cryobacterium glucosi]TFC20637.1 EAL domain-containing protein [Cryobacterium glucosi]